MSWKPHGYSQSGPSIFNTNRRALLYEPLPESRLLSESGGQSLPSHHTPQKTPPCRTRTTMTTRRLGFCVAKTSFLARMQCSKNMFGLGLTPARPPILGVYATPNHLLLFPPASLTSPLSD